MSKNGFFHEYPYHQDIYVSPEVEKIIGKQHINATVTNSRYDENNDIIADCEYEGQIYTAKSKTFGSDTYWLLVK